MTTAARAKSEFIIPYQDCNQPQRLCGSRICISTNGQFRSSFHEFGVPRVLNVGRKRAEGRAIKVEGRVRTWRDQTNKRCQVHLFVLLLVYRQEDLLRRCEGKEEEDTVRPLCHPYTRFFYLYTLKPSLNFYFFFFKAISICPHTVFRLGLLVKLTCYRFLTVKPCFSFLF